MKDAAFKKLMDDTRIAAYKHKNLLAKLETEYERRYGNKTAKGHLDSVQEFYKQD